MEISDISKELIKSSTNSSINGDDVNESITYKAKRVWKRLVCRKLAYYDSETDRYKTFSSSQE